MQILYGGAFDPMTVGHLRIVKQLMETLEEKDSLLLSIATHEYKTYFLSFDQRKRIIENVFRNEGLEKELNSGKIIIKEQDQRTWRWLMSFDNEVKFIAIGEDEWEELSKYKWEFSPSLLSKYRFIVFPRNDEISSTKAREWLKNVYDGTPCLTKFMSKIILEEMNNSPR